METEEIIKEVTFNEVLDSVLLFKRENMHLSFNKCFDKCKQSFKVRWAWSKKKFTKDKESLSLKDKVTIERADKAIFENNNKIIIMKLEIQDKYNLFYHDE